MTTTEFRNHTEYALCMNKIRNYSKGFEFTIPFYKMTKGQQNAMRIVISDAIYEGLIETIATGLNLDLEITEETFKRI